MKAILVGLFLAVPSYIVGDAPWCSADDLGNLSCFYYTHSDCVRSLRYGGGVECVMNPDRGRE